MYSFNEEYTSIWSFKERGCWETHKGDYPGNCSPHVIRNLITKYSKEDDIVLDQFVGSGTTLIECLLLGRKAIGIDINEKPLTISKSRVSNLKGNYRLVKASAIKLPIDDCEIDFICAHPPYMDIIKYSNGIYGDISLVSGDEFYFNIDLVAKESYRVLKNNKYCSIIMGDIRRKGIIEPVGFRVMQSFLNCGFKLKEIIIKEQHNCKSTEKWREIAKRNNFLLIQHEYIFVFKKELFK